MKVPQAQLDELKQRIKDDRDWDVEITYNEEKNQLWLKRIVEGYVTLDSDLRCELPEYVAPVTEDSKLKEVREYDKYIKEMEEFTYFFSRLFDR